ncbi:AAA family ATPase [Thermocatellispora tengchongensis]|uniref:AAA family ATPase n=1 Tax=Thermocatellispora tengchongensis TaxID=1073253 RepID=UPI003640EBB1
MTESVESVVDGFPWDTRSRPGNLAAETSSFVGRAREIEAVKALLAQERLVTLTGVAGVGKTRLALKVARRLSRAFPDGVWVAELSAEQNPGLVAHDVAAALGMVEQSARPEAEVPGRAPGRQEGPDRAGHLRAPHRRLPRPGGAGAAPGPRGAAARHQPPGPGRPRRARRRGRPAAGAPLRLLQPRRLLLRQALPGPGPRARARPRPRPRSRRAPVPPPRRHPARHRAGRAPRPHPVGGADRRPPRRPLRAAHQRQPHPSAGTRPCAPPWAGATSCWAPASGCCGPG